MIAPLRPRQAAFLALLSLAACATLTPGTPRQGETPSDGRLITAEEIAQSGARNAWEALRHTARISLGESSQGSPSRMSMRGRGSILLDDSPIVVLDGVRLVDFRVLRHIDAHAISSIQLLNGIQGTQLYGTGSSGGAIVITTKS